MGVDRIIHLLDEARLGTSWQPLAHSEGGTRFGRPQRAETSYEHELEWLLLGKASVQAYGLILDAVLQRALPIEDDIWYWKDIASTYRYAGLYSIQTSPLRLWKWSIDIYEDVRRRGGGLAHGWSQFYGIVKEAVQERSIADIQRRVVSPLSLAQNEAKGKMKRLRKVRSRCANALGLLLEEGLRYESSHGNNQLAQVADGNNLSSDSDEAEGEHKWKGVIAKNISLMDAVLQTLNQGDAAKFDEAVVAITREDYLFHPHESSGEITSETTFLQTADVAQRLRHVLTHALPRFSSRYRATIKRTGRPSVLIRYWLPASMLLVSLIRRNVLF